MENEHIYDGQFHRNILVVGRTGCDKTIFIQKLWKNKLFGNEITDVFWVSKIVLLNEREDSIRDSFTDQKIHFSYPHDLDDFNYGRKFYSRQVGTYWQWAGRKLASK